MVESDGMVALIDTGIGMHDINDPDGRIGRGAIDAMGFQFHANTTAIRQLETREVDPTKVGHIVLTHCDSDHVGGLADFPSAQVHLAAEEKRSVDAKHPRYTLSQFSHGPIWQSYEENDCDLFGLPARSVKAMPGVDIRLVPLFGHTEGHCGVAVRNGDMWWLHVGDAYYLRDELTNRAHSIDELASLAAENNDLRVRSLETVRKLTSLHVDHMNWFGYHDVAELPAGIPKYNC